MSSEYAIEISGLSKCYQIYENPSDRLKQMLMRGRKQYYKEFWALKNVSFKIRKGETVGIIGRNGSGKSTLLQIICGTLNPTEGEVKVRGRVAALLELGAGFNPEFTGVENVYLAASLYGLSKAVVDQRFASITEFADIGDHVYQPVKTYSSGMYVRLAFAVIAHVDADILVIDEALAVGDAFFTQKCMRFLREFMSKGTVLFVSHDTSAVINLCNMAVWLDRGLLNCIGNPKNIAEDYLASLYGVQIQKNNKTKLISINNSLSSDVQKDPRWDLVNSTNLQNTLSVFKFNVDESRDFGAGGALIKEVQLENTSGDLMLQCIGGEVVQLKILILVKTFLHQPIVGFSVKDKLGQVLFGDNTFIIYKDVDFKANPEEYLVAVFRFQMPILPQGDYTIAAAIATGTQDDHKQEHWIHDAMVIRSLSSSVSTGLVGIPMHHISLEKMENK